MELTMIEYINDPDPSDTTIESIFFYILRAKGSLLVEQDLHVTGLFPLDTWLRLMGDAGFLVEQVNYPVHDGGYGGRLLVGTLSDGHRRPK